MKIRIYYEDTDCGGIVYHTNYLKYCERARSEMFFNANTMPLQNGVGFVVKAMQIEFHYPAKLGDLLEVQTQILEQKSASLNLLQTIYLVDSKESENAEDSKKPKKVFSATITLVCMDSCTHKIAKIPLWAREIFDTLRKD
ncbi:YbgC/FadM family acyl-CoA thioesterase [Helicobacter sp. MIT 05-5294]|uniref:YbgC/FadM family acyl-CoA thioesterase n=1 Tax=Helicobacter sp. MIT 05-5294 TaxID=1548150 RepID=UPI0010FF45B1|nr:YbgC/FadM family acyl-CoA thioesterase [Helicobacter sp. MIT 05-5294]TLD87812.1 YbgC/FadM family acyl-CoA thioesterase [Helicobacter sp. MIT 05-5294]